MPAHRHTRVKEGEGDYFGIGSADQAIVSALLLKRQRINKHGLTLADVSKRLGAKSLNSYARYEQGTCKPTIEMFDRLLAAVSPDKDFVLVESR
ncbi:MAG: helix-turn-helix transcriptional regulator [Desulfomonilia bacterium]|nr:helix-turn-helix transcriptional regulator [Deltaproteobacteria bacterium]MDX9763214.1 helix-turn-helix transcriptional regulator [Desulfomonilia bacterium]HPW69883.1 helix-turn-helix transcriptional regulator [Deltaproteobacteria bacterium]